MLNNARGVGAFVAMTFLYTCNPSALAADVEATLVQTIRTSDFSPPSPDPSGIAYMPASDALLISDSEVNEMGIFQGDNLFLVNRSGQLLDSFSSLLFSDEPAGMAVNAVTGDCFFSDDTSPKKIYVVDPGEDSHCGTADDSVTFFRTGDFGSSDPEGVAYASGKLFIVDGVTALVYRVDAGGNGVFDGVPPLGDDQVSSFSTVGLGVTDPEGIAFNADSGDLYIVGKPRKVVAQVTTAGQLIRTIGISAANAVKPAGLTFAPGSINPLDTNLYLVARGVDNDSDPTENDGRLYELQIPSISSDTQAVSRRVGSGMDDAEERGTGRVKLGSSDLELVDAGSKQTVGMRFTDVSIPRGANIISAAVQFTADERSTNAANLVVQGQAADNAARFRSRNLYDISARPRTAAAISWSPPGWLSTGAAGQAQRTVDLARVVQEIVDRSGWSSGNSLALIVTGSGARVAASYNNDPAKAPLLVVEYQIN